MHEWGDHENQSVCSALSRTFPISMNSASACIAIISAHLCASHKVVTKGREQGGTPLKDAKSPRSVVWVDLIYINKVPDYD